MTVPSVMVDGVRYVPADGAASRIGVGVTTHNRREVFEETIRRIRELTPEARIVVVDDASDDPVADADFRFEQQAGIARSKNKCLEMLADCDHIFLFDDDAYPLVPGWWRPYVESPEPHLMRIFEDVAVGTKLHDITCIYRDSRHVAYSGARGVMLYVDRRVLDVVGGMDVAYGLWGWEHGDWSNRIHAAGLTSWRFADVVGSDELIYSMDEHNAVRRSVDRQTRRKAAESNARRYREHRNLPLYCEFREPRDVVLTCLFTGQPDPQRGRPMKPDAAVLDTLLKSLREQQTVVFCDQLEVDNTDTVTFERVEATINVYFARWLAYWQWLRDRPDVRYVWCVDGTDVEMLHDPFPHMRPGRLYLGSEPTVVGSQWLRDNHKAKRLQDFIDKNHGRQLLNAGLVGGDRNTVMAFVHDLIRWYFDNAIDRWHREESDDCGVGDMAVFNAVAWTRWADKLVYGPQINTVFKAGERNDWSWWRHK